MTACVSFTATDRGVKYLIAVCTLFSTAVYGQSAREIVDRYLETVSNGSVEKWNGIKSIYTESQGYYSQQDFEQRIDFSKAGKPNFHRSYRVLPDTYKDEVYEDSTLSRLLMRHYSLKDRSILLIGKMRPIIRPALPDDEYVSELFPLHIARLLAKSKSVQLLGTKEFPVDGLLCYEVKLSTRARHYFLYINTESYLLEYYSGRKDGDTSFLVRYDDYKNIDGFLIPMLNGMMRNGVVYYWRQIRKIELNAEIDPEVFIYKEN